MADKSTEIAQLESLLDSGARSVSVDGVTTSFRTRADIEKRIRDLREETDGDNSRKPRISSINLGAAW